MLKLSKILFEQNETKAADQHKNPHRFTKNKFALISVDQEANYYALVNSYSYETAMELIGKYNEPPETKEWLAAFGSFSEKIAGDALGNCADATIAGSIVASTEYPAAGYAMYALYSKISGHPLTSDRNVSTTDSAKKLWSKIETSGDWQKIELDNFYPMPDPENFRKRIKNFYDISGTWPNRKINHRPEGAKTPEDPNDDCRLPPWRDDENELDKKLGTANAYIYNGPLDPQPLLQAGSELLQSINDEFNVSPERQKKLIKKAGQDMFQQRYKKP